MQITLMQKLLHMRSTNKTHEFHVNPKILIAGHLRRYFNDRHSTNFNFELEKF